MNMHDLYIVFLPFVPVPFFLSPVPGERSNHNYIYIG